MVPILSYLAQLWCKNFFAGSTSTASLTLFQAIILRNLKESYEPNLRNGKKPNFRPDFDLFWPKLGPKNFISWVLPLLDITHYCKLSLYAISRKTNEPNLRKWQEKTSCRPNFGHLGPNLGPKSFFHFTSTRC